jgi:hypothetical protein
MIPFGQPPPTSTPIGILCGVRLVTPPPFRNSTQQSIPISSQIATTSDHFELFDVDFFEDVADDLDGDANTDKDFDEDPDPLG